jgi:hypothetical protein
MNEEIDFEAECALLKKQFEDQGDRTTVLHAILLAWANHHAVPDWAGAELARIRQQAADGNINSWDDVFGKPWGSGQQRGAQRRAMAGTAYLAVRKMIDDIAKARQGKEPPINNELFEKVVKRHNLQFGRSTLAKLYARVARAVRDRS